MRIELLKGELLEVVFADLPKRCIQVNYTREKADIFIDFVGETKYIEHFYTEEDEEDEIEPACMAIVYDSTETKGIDTHCIREQGHTGKHQDKHGKTRKFYKDRRKAKKR